jgi:hypothetical protein
VNRGMAEPLNLTEQDLPASRTTLYPREAVRARRCRICCEGRQADSRRENRCARRVRKSRAWPLSCPFPCQRGYRAPGPQRHLETISRAAQTRLPHAVPLHPAPRPARPRRRRQGPGDPGPAPPAHSPPTPAPTTQAGTRRPRPALRSAASCHATAGRASSSPRAPCGAGIAAWSPACGPTRTAATDDHRWTTTYSS